MISIVLIHQSDQNIEKDYSRTVFWNQNPIQVGLKLPFLPPSSFLFSFLSYSPSLSPSYPSSSSVALGTPGNALEEDGLSPF